MASQVVYLPLADVENSVGFSLDIGGSICKLMYRSKDEYKNGQLINRKEGQVLGPLQLKLINSNDIESVLTIIKNDCDVTRRIDNPEVVVTGVGLNFCKEKFEQELAIKIKVLLEFDAAIEGLAGRIKMADKNELFLPLAQEGVDEAVGLYSKHVLFRNMAIKNSKFNIKERDASCWQVDGNSPSFPCLLLTCGSGFSMIQVNEDRSYEAAEFLMTGGKCLTNLLRLLVEEKDFGKLLEMAATSDGRTVDVYTDDLINPASNDQSKGYNAMPTGILIFPLGKVQHLPRAAIKDEDVVHSIISQYCHNVVQVAHLAATKHKCPRVYICGTFATSEFVRKALTKEMVFRNIMADDDQKVDFQFLRYGEFLPCIGAFLNGCV